MESYQQLPPRRTIFLPFPIDNHFSCMFLEIREQLSRETTNRLTLKNKKIKELS